MLTHSHGCVYRKHTYIHTQRQTVHRQCWLTVCHGCVYHKHAYIHTHRQFIGNAALQFVMDVCITSTHTFTHTGTVYRQCWLTVYHGCVCHKHTYIHMHRHRQFTGNTALQFIMDVCITSIHAFTHTDTVHKQCRLTDYHGWMYHKHTYMHRHQQFTVNTDLQLMDVWVFSTFCLPPTLLHTYPNIFNVVTHSPQYFQLTLLHTHPNIFS